MWSAKTKPNVIASRRQAPMKRGGARDGISKNRHPAPTTRPRARPIAPVIMIIPYLKVGAIAAQTPQPRQAVHPSVRFLTERVKEIARVSSRIHVVLIHGRVPGISLNPRTRAARSPFSEKRNLSRLPQIKTEKPSHKDPPLLVPDAFPQNFTIRPVNRFE